MNFDILINSCILHIKSKFPQRANSHNKCKRDLEYILEAIFKDIENKSNIFITRIANRFWYDGKRQIVSYEAEISTYRFLLENLKIILDKEQFLHAKNSIDTLCDIIENGPKLSGLGTILVQDALKAEHCQRNWDHDYKIPEEDIDALIKVATTMPSKQNRNYYNLVVSTDKKFNKKIYDLAADPKNSDTPLRNSQVNANILFIYIWNFGFENNNRQFKDNHKHNTAIAVGISSGALALAAAQMDYRVGFCQCFLMDEIIQELEENNIKVEKGAKIELLVGIGKSNKNYLWSQVVENNVVKANIEPFIKQIKIERL